MLKVLLLFIVLIAGIIIGPLVAGHQGYVLIQTDDWDIEGSVTSLVLTFIGIQLVLIVIGSFYRSVTRTGSRTRGWFRGRKRNRARVLTNEALLKLAEGDFKQVEKLLSRSADNAEQPVINYLLAAEAAQRRGDEIRTNQYIGLAMELAGQNQLPVDITRVRIQLEQNEILAARTGIDKLLNVAPRHPEVLRLAQIAYEKAGAWQSLLDILPSMQKSGEFSDVQIADTEQRAYIGLMDKEVASQGCEGLKTWWGHQNRKVRHNVTLQIALIEHLIECDDMPLAEKTILSSLKRQYDDRLVLLIPRIKTDSPNALNKALLHLVKQNGATPLLNSTLGQLALKNAQWDEAERYFKAALAQREDPLDAAWLADALDKQHKSEQAAQIRHDALLSALKMNQ